MATTETTTGDRNPSTTHSLFVMFTVDRSGDEHLENPQAIRDEMTSWLESLGAVVHEVRVRADD